MCGFSRTAVILRVASSSVFEREWGLKWLAKKKKLLVVLLLKPGLQKKKC